jgi:hypothetical protein
MSRRKPHNTDAGYIASRRHPTIKGVSGERGKGWVVIYEAAEQGLDTEGGRYAVVCHSHGNIVNETSLRGARASMKCPQNFCEECRNKEKIIEVLIEVSHVEGSVVVAVEPDTDLEQPFSGRCVETGETLHFRTPWALDIYTDSKLGT